MNRIAVGLLVAATTGALTWWVSQRGAKSELIALAAPEPSASPKSDEPATPADPSVITPKHDIDPGMVKIMPDIDSKMVIAPPWPPRPAQESPGSVEQ